MLTRRLLLVLALALAAPAFAATGQPDPLDRAFRYAFPVYEFARTRAQMLGTATAPGPLLPNNLVHIEKLADSSSRGVTTPNNDTLYSQAWLDLTGGPVLLTVPPLPARYHSVALMDQFTDNFAVLGTRENGGVGGRYLIAGPGWNGPVPAGARMVRARTSDVWLLVRTLVDDPQDLGAARAAQRQFVLDNFGNAGRPVVNAAPANPDAATFVNVVGEMLGRGRLPSGADMRGRPFVPYGIGRNGSWAKLAPALQARWTNALPALRSSLRQGAGMGSSVRDGWSYPSANIGDYGADDDLRASVALTALGALLPLEAIYLTAVADSDGAAFDGTKRYRLRIPPGGIPVKAFWSLSMYEVMPDGRAYFADNPIGRYTIGNRTPGLRPNADGSMDVLIQRDAPDASMASNWLPVPPGPFRMVLRAYLPHRQLLLKFWTMPAVEKLP